VTADDLLARVNAIVANRRAGKAIPRSLHLNPDRTNAFEAAAVRHLQVSQRRRDPTFLGPHVNRACDILQSGVGLSLAGRAIRPSLRLMDLLAGLAVRYGLRARLNAMITLLEDPAFKEVRSAWLTKKGTETVDPVARRIERWKDPNSKWQKRWTATTKQWRFTFETEPLLPNEPIPTNEASRIKLRASSVNLPPPISLQPQPLSQTISD
jgi:hypothetical protein